MRSIGKRRQGSELHGSSAHTRCASPLIRLIQPYVGPAQPQSAPLTDARAPALPVYPHSKDTTGAADDSGIRQDGTRN